MSFPPSSRDCTAEVAVASSSSTTTTTTAAADIYGVSGLPLACVPSLPPPPPPSSTNHSHTHGSSSLRVRFRMTTRQSSQHQFRAKISSNSSSISQSPSSPALSLIAAVASNCNSHTHPTFHSSTSKLNQLQTPPVSETNSNVWFYDDFGQSNRAVSTHNLTNIPINIGLNCTNRRLISANSDANNIGSSNSNFNESSVSSSSVASTKPNATSTTTTTTTTTKTFRLTEDLRSNIRLDITLKPTMSIRDNRLDATSRLNRLKQMHNASYSSNNLMHRSMSCDSTNTLGGVSVVGSVGGGGGGGQNSVTSLAVANNNDNNDINDNINNNSVNSMENFKNSFSCMEVIKTNLNKPSAEYCGEDCGADDSSGYSSRSLRGNPATATTTSIEKDLVSTNIPYRTSIPLNSSITFKIRNFTNMSSETSTTTTQISDTSLNKNDLIRDALMTAAPSLVKTNMSCKRSSSSVCMIKSSSLCRSNSNTSSNNNLADSKQNYKRAHSPFTFIETYSVCKHHQEEQQQQILQRMTSSQASSLTSPRLTLSPRINNTNVLLELYRKI